MTKTDAHNRTHTGVAPAAVRAPEQPVICVNGVDLLPHASGVLYWPDRATLIVSDLHFEKGSAFARRGSLLPPYDTSATLKAMTGALEILQPDRVISLGDSFDDLDAGNRLSAEDRETISTLTSRYEWIWITGNHDADVPSDLGGRIVPELTDGALVFRHEATIPTSAQRSKLGPASGAGDGRPHGEISGHYHPKARIKTRARSISARCFVADARRLIMPSFGAYTGGLSVTDAAISQHFPEGFGIWILGRDQVFAFPGETAR